MANTLVRVYDSFSNAERARDQLLEAGFPASKLHLASTEDEAGPVQGNFTVGNADSSRRGISDMIDSRNEANDGNHTYQHDYADPVQRGSCILTVDADNDDEFARASDITNRFGAIDINERTSRQPRPAP